MRLSIPDFALVVLIGASGSGKSTFARDHFKPTEVISSDFCRGLVSDDENDQTVSKEAFEVLHFIAGKRLANRKLTVIDATNVQASARKPLIQLARQHHCLPVAIVLNPPEKVCWERTQSRLDRQFGLHVVRRHRRDLRRSLKQLKREGFRMIHELKTVADIDSAEIVRKPLWNDKRTDHGPFDIIGDIHGCADELEGLLDQLGYEQAQPSTPYHHPDGRKAIFVGDLVDRGPRVLDTCRIVQDMVEAETAYCVPGNHDVKLLRWLDGRNVRVTYGLEQTIAEIEQLPDESREATKQTLAAFIRQMVSHYVFDDGNLVVAHAGLPEHLQGRASGRVREFALYGQTTGEKDEYGLPVRLNWAADYRGDAMVVYGHTPVATPEWLNRTINIDTGCVFGGKLTALRYPEAELVSVPAREEYAESARPFLPDPTAPLQPADQGPPDTLLRLQDIAGKRVIETKLRRSVVVREENAIAALEVMSRFAVAPNWLIYLPPTMSPSETSQLPGLLEHPAEAFAYYRSQGVEQVVCEQKHMGSRAVVVVCQDAEAAQTRFGVAGDSLGICYTRTGRRFFTDAALERAFLERVRDAITAAGWWERFDTTWVCLDCELMPWSVKAQGLLKNQYAAVGAAGRGALAEALAVLEATAAHHEEVEPLLEKYQAKQQRVMQYSAAYRPYCWPVNDLTDLSLAPFHLLAAEGQVFTDQTHVWHMDTLAELATHDPALFLATPYKVVALENSAEVDDATAWWTALTSEGSEGMVVKPLDFVVQSSHGVIQPAVKVRGPEYLRIIYGPEYSAPENLDRLRSRGLGAKRSLALREFALGLEALDRFVRREPLYRVHECVFGVLALESEPVDPRL